MQLQLLDTRRDETHASLTCGCGSSSYNATPVAHAARPRPRLTVGATLRGLDIG